MNRCVHGMKWKRAALMAKSHLEEIKNTKCFYFFFFTHIKRHISARVLCSSVHRTTSMCHVLLYAQWKYPNAQNNATISAQWRPNEYIHTHILLHRRTDFLFIGSSSSSSSFISFHFMDGISARGRARSYFPTKINFVRFRVVHGDGDGTIAIRRHFNASNSARKQFRCIQVRIFIRIDYSRNKWKEQCVHLFGNFCSHTKLYDHTNNIYVYIRNFNPFHSHTHTIYFDTKK